ncbi:MAG: uracil-DNA glycosylase, partial [Pseudomonadota bacterium]
AAQLPHPAETADSIDALAALCEACDAGDLKAGARNFCFADGRPGASLMVIGEAPGAEEDRLARPFVGRAGQLLDSMLAAIGRTREAETPDRAVYIANILPWRPAGNRTPTEAEMALFLPFVERHIALADPAVLLLLGNTPVRALLEDRRGITRTRGTWQAHGPTGIRAMPSFHPAFLLRT